MKKILCVLGLLTANLSYASGSDTVLAISPIAEPEDGVLILPEGSDDIFKTKKKVRIEGLGWVESSQLTPEMLIKLAGGLTYKVKFSEL